MADRPPYSDSGDDTGRGRVPRWVQLAGIIVAVVILLLVVVMLASGAGGHTPPVTH